MDVSCWSFIRMAHLAEPLMKNGGTLFTMTYYGSQMVVENYNIMGVAKAALEMLVRYLAAELGPKGIRVHAISPGPLATRAASGIPEFDALLDKAKTKAPARQLVRIDDVGVATAFLAHDAARLITGETLLYRRRLPHHRLTSPVIGSRSRRNTGGSRTRPSPHEAWTKGYPDGRQSLERDAAFKPFSRPGPMEYAIDASQRERPVLRRDAAARQPVPRAHGEDSAARARL